MRTRIIAAIALGSVQAAVPAVGLLGNEVVAQQAPNLVPSPTPKVPSVVLPAPQLPANVPPPPPGSRPSPQANPAPPIPVREISRTIPRIVADETRGQAIEVAGRNVQLPPDAYVEGIVMGVMCTEGQPCPETPWYDIRRGQSRMNLAKRSGQVLLDRPAPGDERAFDDLKRQLPQIPPFPQPVQPPQRPLP